MPIIEELYFALPIYIGNMMPVFARKIPFLNYPINKKLFGSHKTVRGYISAIIAAIIIFYIQLYLYDISFFRKISLINYNQENIFLLGFLSGFGAITGDLIKSFFKRKKGIKPGHKWVPFDQLDFMAGALILLYPFVKLTLTSMSILILLTPFLHVLTNHIGYFLKIRETKW
jgi:CDP-2,3-bis-(O-geranylgeranyl)-sn-glycerol synthase